MTGRSFLAWGMFALAVAWTAQSANAVTLSDQLVVTKGTTSCNVTITEPATETGSETPVACLFGSSISPTSTTMPTITSTMLTSGSLKVVGLTEPVGTAVPVSTPSGTVQVSDLVVAVQVTVSGVSATAVALVSDGGLALPALAALIPPPTNTSFWSSGIISFTPETGSLQDLTSALGLSASGATVQALSDVEVPEPQTAALLLAGLGLLGWRARGGRRS